MSNCTSTSASIVSDTQVPLAVSGARPATLRGKCAPRRRWALLLLAPPRQPRRRPRRGLPPAGPAVRGWPASAPPALRQPPTPPPPRPTPLPAALTTRAAGAPQSEPRPPPPARALRKGSSKAQAAAPRPTPKCGLGRCWYWLPRRALPGADSCGGAGARPRRGKRSRRWRARAAREGEAAPPSRAPEAC